MSSSIGIVGIGAMGRNLALNLILKGHTVSAYDIDSDQLQQLQNENSNIRTFTSLGHFVDSLAKPRSILLSVSSHLVDEVLSDLLNFVEKEDSIIDGGNSHYKLTQTRQVLCEEKGIEFVGLGISGGPKGAKTGPSMMFGGKLSVWNRLSSLLQSIAAKSKEGLPCIDYLGDNGAGHFVKTIHNGIEYADMQLIAETYEILKRCNSLGNEEISDIFKKWNQGILSSYLLEISAEILVEKEQDRFLVDLIIDKAAQKGTGRWSSEIGLEYGIPLDLITIAVQQRIISSHKDKRVILANLYESNHSPTSVALEDLASAYLFARLLILEQAFNLIITVNTDQSWKINGGKLVKIWENGCIIRSSLIHQMSKLEEKDFSNLLLNPDYQEIIQHGLPSLQKILSSTITSGVSSPLFSSVMQYFLSITTSRLPSYLIQAQRDYFGSHGFERSDRTGLYRHKWLD
ncbi:MAG: NADP-dependent phosphogluconate dehydrogenase [Candidatus Kariarchaeaceae archaeon]